jgi:type I restriction enzyme S subunit
VARSNWETVPLGDVAELDIERVSVEPDAEYRVGGVLIAGQGLFWRDTIRGRETNYATLNRLRAGQLVMRKLTAWEGPITTVPDEFSGGYVSGEFPTFTLNEARLLPGYMRLICERPAFHAEMRRMSTGTAERRNRLKPADLLAIEVDLPPVEEQAQIIRVIATVDAVIEAQRECVSFGYAALKAMQSEVFDGADAGGVAIRDFTNVVSGGTPKTDEPTYWGGGVPFVKTADVAFHDIREVGQSITQAGLQNSSAKVVPPETVLVAMYGRGTVGRSAFLARPMATNQACAAILPSERHSARYLFHWLWHSYDAIIELAEGTTNLTNISKGIVESLAPPLPDVADQVDIAARLDRLLDAIRADEQELATVARLRASLLDALATGDQRVRDADALAAA